MFGHFVTNFNFPNERMQMGIVTDKEMLSDGHAEF